MFKNIALASDYFIPIVTWENGKYGIIEQIDSKTLKLRFVERVKLEDYSECKLSENNEIIEDVIVAKGFLVFIIIQTKLGTSTSSIFFEYLHQELDAFLDECSKLPEAWKSEFIDAKRKEFYTKKAFNGNYERIDKIKNDLFGCKLFEYLTEKEEEYLRQMLDNYYQYFEERVRLLYSDEFIKRQENVENTNIKATDNTQKEETDNSKPKELCEKLSPEEELMLAKAEKEGIIVYDPIRKGYKLGSSTTQRLVAYLCGRLFCSDKTEKEIWKIGCRFNRAKTINTIFGFDVARTRTAALNSGGSMPPIGYERIDKLFETSK